MLFRFSLIVENERSLIIGDDGDLARIFVLMQFGPAKDVVAQNSAKGFF